MAKVNQTSLQKLRSKLFNSEDRASSAQLTSWFVGPLDYEKIVIGLFDDLKNNRIPHPAFKKTCTFILEMLQESFVGQGRVRTKSTSFLEFLVSDNVWPFFASHADGIYILATSAITIMCRACAAVTAPPAITTAQRNTVIHMLRGWSQNSHSKDVTGHLEVCDILFGQPWTLFYGEAITTNSGSNYRLLLTLLPPLVFANVLGSATDLTTCIAPSDFFS